MELYHKRHKTSKFAPQDFISDMPDIVITNILDRLPLQDAVRTGVLSRNWRFKWTMLSQLVFDDDFFKYLSKTQGKNNHVRIISRIILHHLRGSITKFVLFLDDVLVLDAKHIRRWIRFLSRKGIKDLTINNLDVTLLNLPTHLFSCLELEHLKLYNCYFNPPPTFHGFPNLLSLDLFVEIEEDFELGKFLTGCPLLEDLTMDDLFEVSKVKVVEIAKLENLKILSSKFYDLDDISVMSSSTIFELLGSLPKLQELDLDFQDCQLREGGAKKRFSTVFPCLKALKLSIYLDNGMNLSRAFELIRSFPNLQTLEITTTDLYDVQTPAICSQEVEYNTMESLQLRSVTCYSSLLVPCVW
ncbi:putative F-box domain, leucine-rich repeat domain superfamily, F-box-like domain superfamily [Helianthus debilis subsp. tardiflorus]